MKSDNVFLFYISAAIVFLLYSVYQWNVSEDWKEYYYYYIELIAFIYIFSLLAVHRYDRYKEKQTLKNFSYYLSVRDFVFLGVGFLSMQFFEWEVSYLSQVFGLVILIAIHKIELYRWKRKNYNRNNT